MIQPQSVEHFDSMTKIQQALWVNYETANEDCLFGSITYPQYNFAIYYERNGRKITSITAETMLQHRQRILLRLLAMQLIFNQ